MLKPERKIQPFLQGVFPFISALLSEKQLKVISNQPAYVELNGEKITKGRPQEGIIDFRVNLEPGKNELKVFNAQSKLQDSLELKWQKPDFSASDYLALNFGTKAFFTAEDGQGMDPCGNIGNCGNRRRGRKDQKQHQYQGN